MKNFLNAKVTHQARAAATRSKKEQIGYQTNFLPSPHNQKAMILMLSKYSSAELTESGFNTGIPDCMFRPEG